jgi:hypothetical protein
MGHCGMQRGAVAAQGLCQGAAADAAATDNPRHVASCTQVARTLATMCLAAALFLTWLVKLAVVSVAALYPLRGSLWRLQRFFDLAELFSLANSNLDVWALTLAHTLVLAVLLTQAMAPKRRFSGLVVAPHYTRVSRPGCCLPGLIGRAATAGL